MHADVGGRRSDGDDGRDQVLRTFLPRCVDDHVRHPVLLEERERVRPVLVVEPACVPELNKHLVVAEPLARPLEVLEREILVDDVRRELHEDPAELAGLPNGIERLAEAPEDLVAPFARGPLDAPTRVGLETIAQVRRDLLELHRMACHRGEGLDVEDEVVGSALGPVRRRLRLG